MTETDKKMGDATRAALIALLVAGAFLAGVLTANQQTREIISEVQDTAESVKEDLEAEIRRQNAAAQAHRRRDRIHVCTAAIDHLASSVALHNLALQAGLEPIGIRTKLRPEVLAVCSGEGFTDTKQH